MTTNVFESRSILPSESLYSSSLATVFFIALMYLSA